MFDGFIITRTCVSGDCIELQVTKTHLTVTSSQRMYLSHPMTPGGKQPRGQSWGSAGRRGTSNFCPLLHTHCSTILSYGRWVFQTHSSVAGSQKVKGTGKGTRQCSPLFRVLLETPPPNSYFCFVGQASSQDFPTAAEPAK